LRVAISACSSSVAASASPSTAVAPGFTIPALSWAMASTVSPSTSVWSSETFVHTATVDATTFVASKVPPRPTSTTATSTASSAKCSSPPTVSSSNLVSRASSAFSRSRSRPSTAHSASSSIGAPATPIRSFTACRSGLVYVPTRRPVASSRLAAMAVVEPLPFVPVTWTQGTSSWGSPSARRAASSGSRVGRTRRVGAVRS